jgi:hypothetical protein
MESQYSPKSLKTFFNLRGFSRKPKLAVEGKGLKLQDKIV